VIDYIRRRFADVANSGLQHHFDRRLRERLFTCIERRSTSVNFEGLSNLIQRRNFAEALHDRPGHLAQSRA